MNAPIVCATDLSDTSRPALEQALRLADALHTPVSVLFVAPPPYPAPGFFSLAAEDADVLGLASDRVRRAAQVGLDKLVNDTKAALGLTHVPTHTVVRQGLPSEVIVQEAEAEGAELIVVGTHARTGLPHLLLGSVAERVMRTSTRPVLTVAP
jgi:nucleotide-binding universal stress UspA family protein